MAFKLRQPIKIDPVARYEVPFQPDNFEDKTGLVARANDNGNMIVNKNIPKDSKLRKVAESHEDHHLRDIMDGKLAYDDKAVYHNMDGKGMKRTPRSEFNESNKNLPWEAPAYAAGEKMEQKDMRPNPEKLDGPPNMYDDTPLAFVKQMGKRKRSSDIEKVSMNERFGTAMIKKFGKGFNLEVNLDDTSDEGEKEKEKLKAKAKANAEAELAKKNYTQETMPDGRIRFYKSAEGSASETINTPGGSGASGGTVGFRAAYENADKEKYPTFEEFKIAASAYNEKIKKPTSSTSTQTATASDEYFEDEPTITTTTDDGDDDGGDDSSTFTYTTTEKKGKNKLFDGSGKRKIQGKIRDFKATCKKGFLRKGSKCVAKGEKSIRRQLKRRK